MTRGKVVILGMMTKMPVAGVVWQNVHYLKGFEMLGFEPFYVEAHARTPTMLLSDDSTDGSELAAEFIAGVMSRFDLGNDRWAFHALHADGRVHGMSLERLLRLYREACLIVNLHGGTTPRPEHAETGRLVYLETDPVQLQVELAANLQESLDFLAPHVAFFTFAENLGEPGCGLPSDPRFRFVPTRQPVVLDYWGGLGPPQRDAFTTIGNWRQRWRDVTYDDETYHWSKHHEFMKVIDLPSRTSRWALELALSSIGQRDSEMLQSHGWRVVDGMARSQDTQDYRAYIAGSSGEFTVAKDQNVRLRTGWFSDRSATYLAAGRPVVTQDTGFGSRLPTGEGLFAYQTVEEAASALDAIASDPPRHQQRAQAIARDYFDAATVLGELVREVGL
jgi:hypothetical protein